MNPILSVSELNQQIKTLMEATFLNVATEGEISNLTKHSSGHIYFSIKDENSSIRCVLFKGNAMHLKFNLENGQKVIVYGGVSVYIPRGEYQILCKTIEPSGVGALSLAYEQLKNKLEKKGYFDKEKKKPLPLFPKKIALLTSSTGAALQDMKRVAQNRWPLSKFVEVNTLVQGSEAKYDLVKNIGYIDSFYGTQDSFDVIVIARGGGSKEDLWAFNEEEVAQAIFLAKTPIVSAIGHEIDFVISDFVADLRAPTPSACMEMILPDKKEWLLRLDEIAQSMEERIKNLFSVCDEKIKSLRLDFKQISYEVRFEKNSHQISELREYFHKNFQNLLDLKFQSFKALGLDLAMEYFFSTKNNQIKEAKLLLEAKNPKNFVQSGYAQIIKSGKITPLSDLKENDEFEILDTQTQIDAKVIGHKVL